VYPIARGVAPVVVLAASLLLSTDQMTMLDGAATVCIAMGILLFSKQQQNAKPAVWYALATGVCIAGYSFLAGNGVRQAGSVLGYLAWSELLTGLGLIPVVLVLRRGRVKVYVAQNVWPILFAGTLAMAGFGIALWAFDRLPLAPVTAVRESSIAFAVLIGYFFLKEKFDLAKGLGLIAVLIGVTTLVIA